MSDQAGVTTLPSAGVLEPEAPPPPTSKPPSKGTLVGALAALPGGADTLMAHALRCLETRAGTDVMLQFACYSARLSGSTLETLSRTALRRWARRVVAMAFHLPPSTSVVLSTAPAPPAAAAAMRLAGRFKALSALLGETRTVNRLWGLLGLYFAMKRLVVAPRVKGEGSRIDSTIAYAQVLLLILYQVFENLSYLGTKKVVGLREGTRARMAMMSVRCWGGWIGIELARLLVERWRTKRRGVDEKDEGEGGKKWRKRFLRNLAWAPVVVNWSMKEGPLPDLAVSLLAMYPSTSQMMDLWRETA